MYFATSIDMFKTPTSGAAGLAILALAAAIGLSIGAIPIRGLKLGISGVLFSSLIFRQIGLSIDIRILEFLRDFALIIFMYAIGLQIGPGFGASFSKRGLHQNVLAFCVIVLGALLTVALIPLAPKAAAGIYCGAFTTTPGLAAVQETLRAVSPGGDAPSAAALSSLAYSITYPFGLIGPMLVIAFLKNVFHVRMDAEQAALAAAEQKDRSTIEIVDFEVTEAKCDGKRLYDYTDGKNRTVVFTRMLRDEVVSVPNSETIVHRGDRYRVIGPREQVAELVTLVGRRSDADLSTVQGDVSRREFVVTNRPVLRRSLRELNLPKRTGVVVAAVHRSGVDLVATGSLRLSFGDRVTAVGPKAGLELVEAEVGNSIQALDHSQLAPIFLGIVAATILGSIPLTIPKLQSSIHFGLAGGALVAAIGLSRVRSLGPIVWHMPAAANQLFRDFGLAIFLACVGFQAGDHFIQRASNSTGMMLLGLGAFVTLAPLLIVACFARLVLRMNFIELAGWIAGAMSSSTTLQFASELTGSNTPTSIYATVAPLAELLPIICAQLLAFCIPR